MSVTLKRWEYLSSIKNNHLNKYYIDFGSSGNSLDYILGLREFKLALSKCEEVYIVLKSSGKVIDSLEELEKKWEDRINNYVDDLGLSFKVELMELTSGDKGCSISNNSKVISSTEKDRLFVSEIPKGMYESLKEYIGLSIIDVFSLLKKVSINPKIVNPNVYKTSKEYHLEAAGLELVELPSWIHQLYLRSHPFVYGNKILKSEESILILENWKKDYFSFDGLEFIDMKNECEDLIKYLRK